MLGVTPDVGLKYTIFKTAIKQFATEEQLQQWSSKKIFGQYANTELNDFCSGLKKINTRAVYNQEN